MQGRALNRTTRQRRRRAALLAVSIGLHAVLLGLLAIGGGVVTYRTYQDADAVHIELVRPDLRRPEPRLANGPSSPEAPQIHVRAPEPQPIPPTVNPSPFAPRPSSAATGGNAGGAAIGSAPHPGPLPAGPQANVRGALRSSVFACANADAVGLNRSERDRCDERMGAIALAARPQRADIDPAKRREWDYDAARAAARRRQRENQPIGQGVDTSSGPEAKPIPW
jgi:hypothetical protein